MARLGIIGGTGLLEMEGLEVGKRREDATRWGAPSGPVLEGELEGRAVAFLHRHGTPSRIPPHRINYRANISALTAAGCDRIIAVAAVGGIRADLGPGTLVIPDQIVDYTWGRGHTFFEEDLHSPVHVDFTRPYDEGLAAVLAGAAAGAGVAVAIGGTYACTQGPRLESAAEIDRLERDGCDLVGMTGMPEAALAREAGIAYAHLAVVVNEAAGRAPGPISMAAIAAVLESAMAKVCKVIRHAAARGLGLHDGEGEAFGSVPVRRCPDCGCEGMTRERTPGYRAHGPCLWMCRECGAKRSGGASWIDELFPP